MIDVHELITRHRETINGIEEAVLDHFIVCKEMFKLVNKMIIDEVGQYTLTKYTNKSGDKTCAKESDHRTIVVELNIKWNAETSTKEERVEVFNYRNEENFAKFVSLTNDNNDLLHCFDDQNEDFEKSSKRWLKILKNIIKSSFTKTRVKKKKLPVDLENLFEEKEGIKAKNS